MFSQGSEYANYSFAMIIKRLLAGCKTHKLNAIILTKQSCRLHNHRHRVKWTSG